MPTTTELKSWLESVGCENVRECTLTFETGIGNRGQHETMHGCYYEQNGSPRFYVLGGLPKCSVRRMGNKVFNGCRIPQSKRSCCFNLKGDFDGHPQLSQREWYTAGWWMPPTPNTVNEHQPMGANSLLGCWDHDDKIDQYERNTYERFAVRIDWL